MKVVTSITLFNDAIGLRMSASYSEIDDTTGQVISDNKRIDRVVTDKSAKDANAVLVEYAQGLINTQQ